MSRIIATAAIRGTSACIARAETMFAEAIQRHGRDAGVLLRWSTALPRGKDGTAGFKQYDLLSVGR
jgi:hypothetical protein